MKELLLYMAKNLVDDPDSVTVTETSDEDGKVLELRTDVEGLKAVNRNADDYAALVLTVEGISAEVSRQKGNEEQFKEELTRVAQTADSLSLQVEKINENGGGKIVTATGYVFDETGLHIKKAGEEMENKLDGIEEGNSILARC